MSSSSSSHPSWMRPGPHRQAVLDQRAREERETQDAVTALESLSDPALATPPSPAYPILSPVPLVFPRQAARTATDAMTQLAANDLADNGVILMSSSGGRKKKTAKKRQAVASSSSSSSSSTQTLKRSADTDRRAEEVKKTRPDSTDQSAAPSSSASSASSSSSSSSSAVAATPAPVPQKNRIGMRVVYCNKPNNPNVRMSITMHCPTADQRKRVYTIFDALSKSHVIAFEAENCTGQH